MIDKKMLEKMRLEGLKYVEEKENEEKQHIKKYTANGIVVHCIHCQHDEFSLDKALLNTRGMTYFGFDWLNDDAHTLTCTRCGFIHWFQGHVTQAKLDEDE